MGEVRRAWESGAAWDRQPRPAGLQRQASHPPPLSDSTNVVGFQLNVRPDPLLIPTRPAPGEPASTVTTHRDPEPVRASSIGTVQRVSSRGPGLVEDGSSKVSALKSQWRLCGPALPRSRQAYPSTQPYHTSSLKPMILHSSATDFVSQPSPSPAAIPPTMRYPSGRARAVSPH